MAAIVERDGQYYAQFYDDNRSPTRKRFSLKTNRKRTARKLLIQFEDDYRVGDFDPWTDDPWSYDEEEFRALPIEKAKVRYLDRKRSDGKTENTIRTYREVIELLIAEIGEHTVLDSIKSSDVRQFIRDSSLAEATQRKRFNQLKTFFRWCMKANLLRSSPLRDVEPPKKPDKLPKAITKEELEEVCEAVRKDYAAKRKKGHVQEGGLIWRIPLYQFAFYTGMRGSEIARLRWRDLDFDNELVYIREQKNRKEQTIPFISKAQQALDEVRREEPDDYVFRSPSFEEKERNPKWFRENVSDAFRKARRDAGLREELSFHSLRHGFCTMLAEAGKSAVVIKEAARHADISTSMRYVHMANERLKARVEDAF
jgi:site-specific recombinase XerD